MQMEEDNNTDLQSCIVSVNGEQMDQQHIAIPIPEGSDAEGEEESFFERKPECCIYKVSEHLRTINEEAYTPRMVSIGPIHHNNPRLGRMEEEKKRLKRKFMERTSKDLVKEFKIYIKCEIAKISACYDDDYSKGYSLESIILTDVIFIFELILMRQERQNDFLVNTMAFIIVVQDLQLLENQIPYFVFKELFKKFGDPDDAFLKLLNFFRGTDHGLSANSLQNIKHFTDLSRCVLLERFPPPKDCPLEDISYIPSATKLQASGVKLTKCGDQNQVIRCSHEHLPLKLLPCIKTKQLVLKMPLFQVDDQTEYFIRNVMAFEQLHYPRETQVCNLVVFMDYLIDTDKDVDLLVEKGILGNNLGDNLVIASMFNRLGLQISVSECYYGGVVKKLREHNEKPWNHAMATLKRAYFRDPWKGTATITAAVFLFFTLIQIVCSIIQTICSLKQGNTH